jgi:hypothetical protein
LVWREFRANAEPANRIAATTARQIAMRCIMQPRFQERIHLGLDMIGPGCGIKPSLFTSAFDAEARRLHTFVIARAAPRADSMVGNDEEKREFSFSRHIVPEFCIDFRPPKDRGRREGRVAACTRGPRAGIVARGALTTGTGGSTPAFPARWLYGLLRALSGEPDFVVTVPLLCRRFHVRSDSARHLHKA